MKRWRVAIVGAGWSGLAAAVSATNAGHQVTVFEASRSLGGRARCLPASSQALLPDGSAAVLDNGQHILIGAYQETLALMYQLGLSPGKLLLRVPLNLRFDDGKEYRDFVFGVDPVARQGLETVFDVSTLRHVGFLESELEGERMMIFTVGGALVLGAGIMAGVLAAANRRRNRRI